MAEYTLHCFAQSGNAYKPALMLALSGANWEPRFVDFFKGETKTPEYRALNAQHEVAVLLDELTPESVAGAIGKLLNDRALYARLQENCLLARSVWNWENEEKELLRIWAAVFTTAPPSRQKPARRQSPES